MGCSCFAANLRKKRQHIIPMGEGAGLAPAAHGVSDAAIVGAHGAVKCMAFQRKLCSDGVKGFVVYTRGACVFVCAQPGCRRALCFLGGADHFAPPFCESRHATSSPVSNTVQRLDRRRALGKSARSFAQRHRVDTPTPRISAACLGRAARGMVCDIVRFQVAPRCLVTRYESSVKNPPFLRPYVVGLSRVINVWL